MGVRVDVCFPTGARFARLSLHIQSEDGSALHKAVCASTLIGQIASRTSIHTSCTNGSENSQWSTPGAPVSGKSRQSFAGLDEHTCHTHPLAAPKECIFSLQATSFLGSPAASGQSFSPWVAHETEIE